MWPDFFFFLEVSEALDSFAKISLVLEIKNVAIFIKTRLINENKAA